MRFAADRAGKVLDERVFRGPLADQIRGCLGYFEGLSHAHLQKHRDRNQVRGWVGYPQIAFREALVNAVYHRATDAYRQRGPSWAEVNGRLLSEARDQLERVMLMNAPATRHAWAWRDLALVRQRLQAPRSDVIAAYERACELLPDESRFTKELDRFRARSASSSHSRNRNRRRTE